MASRGGTSRERMSTPKSNTLHCHQRDSVLQQKLELGAHVESVDLETRTVRLSSGKTYTGDAIVGADGIRTSTGKSAIGDTIKSLNTSFSAYRCLLKSSKLREDPDLAFFVDCAKVLLIVGENRRIVIYPCSSWEYLNVVGIFPDDSDRRAQWRERVQFKTWSTNFASFIQASARRSPWPPKPGSSS